MELILVAIVVVIWLGIVAFAGAEGLWSNVVLLFNVILAALVATNTFEPAAQFLSEKVPKGKYFWDLIVVWGIFAITLLILRLLTDRLSRVKVRFLPPIEDVGKWLMAAVVGWVMVCFGMMTLHTAPLVRNFLFGGFKPDQKMFFGAAPDRQWLGFMNMVSRGSLARGGTEENPNLHEFDPEHRFMSNYARRRTAYGLDDTMFGKSD